MYEKRHPYVLLALGSLLVGAMVWGQTLGSKVSPDSSQSSNVTETVPYRGQQIKYDYDGSSNMIYRGWAFSQNRKAEWTINLATLVNLVDSGTTGTINFGTPHCLEVDNSITLAGFTGDADINTIYKVATVTDSDTITVTTANVTDATYNNAGASAYTIAPRACDVVWSIKKYYYDGSNNLTKEAWGDGDSDSYNLVWDNRTTYVYH